MQRSKCRPAPGETANAGSADPVHCAARERANETRRERANQSRREKASPCADIIGERKIVGAKPSHSNLKKGIGKPEPDGQSSAECRISVYLMIYLIVDI